MSVAVPVAVDRGFSYLVPDEWASIPEAGSRVLVGFGRRVLVGIVRNVDLDKNPGGPAVGIGDSPKAIEIRPLLECLDKKLGRGPALSPDLVSLCEWIQDYYVAPVGEVYRLALPGLMTNADARVVKVTTQGKTMLDAGSLFCTGGSGETASEAQLKILRVLESGGGSSRAKGGMAVSALIRAVKPATGMYARLDVMEHKGWIDWHWEDDSREARSEQHLRRTDYLRGASGDEHAVRAIVGRSKIRRGVLDYLEMQRGVAEQREEAAGWVALAELRASFPRAKELVAPLVDAGLVTVEERLRSLDAFDPVVEEVEKSLVLTDEQEHVLAALRTSFDEKGFSCTLLQGITGSGKTEVYLQLIATARAEGAGAIVLVPEIALTPQLASRFQARFGEEVAVLHSGLTPRQRLDAWEHIRQGKRPIVIGARSAIFAPIPQLRVIVVDEEHDTSFKQDEGVRYHARDVALVRARICGATVVLGSATPSLESFENARRGRYLWLHLRNRPSQRPLPEVEILPLSIHRADPDTMLSARLKDAIVETVAQGGQVIVFLNRRGYTASITCKDCGAFQQCPDCSAPSMTYHLKRNRLMCHLCGHIESAPRTCLACGGESLIHGRAGTERIELAMAAALPNIRVLRLDRDTSRGANLTRTLASFRAGEADLLVGTQMLSKGHDFPGVTLVGVLQGDHGLAIPDMRSGERTFQLLTQVAGRAGRGDRPGKVIVQAWKTEHPALKFAMRHDFSGFASQELELREPLGNPPFGHLALVHIQGPLPEAVRERAEQLGGWISTLIDRVESSSASTEPEPSGESGGEMGATELTPLIPRPVIQRLGPVPSPIERVNRKTRWQILLRARSRVPLRWLLRALRPALGRTGSGLRETQARVDVDPQSLL